MKPQIVMIVEPTAAATWTTETDVLEQDVFGQQLKVKNYPRVLTNFAVVGSTALAAGMQLVIGNETVAKVVSTNATAFDSLDKHALDAEVLPGESVVITPTAQSGTNVFVVYVEFDEHPFVKLKKAQSVMRPQYKRNYRRY